MPAKVITRLTAANRLEARHVEVEREERREAMHILLSKPLLTAENDGESLRLVRRHGEWLRDWFLRWAGWPLIIGADIARLRKHASPRKDATRGLIDKSTSSERSQFTRRRYALLCLVLATLENEQRQTTIQQVARKTEVAVRIDPVLQELEFGLDAKLLSHRRELVAVMRFLQQQHVLIRSDGDDSGYVRGDGDCLYRIERSALAGILCSVRAASTVKANSIDEFLEQLNETEAPESTEAQNRELQHKLVRRLLDDPVMYFDELTAREYEYFSTQGERLTKSIAEATGMIIERRAEGVAMLDLTGGWTDLGLPETGTRGHATLLIAEWLGEKLRNADQLDIRVPKQEIREYVAALAAEHQSRWRKNADSAEGIRQIFDDSIDILQALSLLDVVGDNVIPRPAIARYRIGELGSRDSLEGAST